eukprot:1535948-Pyramimonas_sp.AAC.1
MVVALHDLAEGEELCHSYVQERDLLEERRRQLAPYAFVCACAKCAKEEEHRKKKDRKVT